MLSDSVTGLIRTAVPALVGTVIAWLVGRGIEIDAATQTALATGLVTVCISAYYALVVLLERRVNPAFGWLLGKASAPHYDRG
jgi:uncharacterized membrane protein (DUF441 family)